MKSPAVKRGFFMQFRSERHQAAIKHFNLYRHFSRMRHKNAQSSKGFTGEDGRINSVDVLDCYFSTNLVINIHFLQ